MTSVTIRDGHPAIDVKAHYAGGVFWPAAFDSLPESPDDGAQEIGATTAADIMDAAYNVVVAEFWDTALAAAEAGGYTIEQDGRSGGWLVFPQWLEDDTEDDGKPYWLDDYVAVREWAEAYIVNAPDRIRRIAQDIAMSEVGRPAAERAFGTPVTRTIGRDEMHPAFLAAYPNVERVTIESHPTFTPAV